MKAFFLLTIVSVTFFACNRKCKLPEQKIGTREIIPFARVLDPLQNLDEKEKQYVIQSDSANIFQLQVSFDDIETVEEIDFSNYTLLGLTASGTCNAIFKRDVSRNNATKKVIYSIEVMECGTCKKLKLSYNWVLVPKIPNDYEVLFEVI